MVAASRQVQDGISDGSGSRSHGQGADTTFQGGDSLFKHILGGIGQTAVDVSGIRQSESGRSMGGIVENIG